ncbi:hypothetical protein BH10ACI3_BH10ACI3_16520 [soil metagenome]
MGPHRSIIMVIAALVLLASSCGMTAQKVALNQMCQQPDNALIRTEGFFRLPQTSDRSDMTDIEPDRYRLLLVEKSNGAGAFITAIVGGTDTKERNRIDMLPVSYTYNDFHINTDAGTQLSARDKVAVAGRVLKDSRPCVLRVERIETP